LELLKPAGQKTLWLMFLNQFHHFQRFINKINESVAIVKKNKKNKTLMTFSDQAWTKIVSPSLLISSDKNKT